MDILLLVAGAAIILTPIAMWYISMDTPLYYWPYSFAFGPVLKARGRRSGEGDREPGGSGAGCPDAEG